MHAQDSIKSSLALKHNEVRVDLLNLIGFQKLNLTYERYWGKNISTGVSLSYADSKKVNDDFDNGFRNTFPKYEVVPFMRYNFRNSLNHFYFAEIFASANGGDFRETVRLIDENNNGYYTIQKTNYSDLAIGASVGYKLYFKQNFGVEVLVGFGRNLINRDKSPDILSRVGLSVGYRF
jgi:hypothetical protein